MTQKNNIVRFSATAKGGIALTKELADKLTAGTAKPHEVLAYEFARNGVAPEVLPADSIFDITPPTTDRTANNVMITTGPGDKDGRATSATGHIMPRSATTMNVDFSSDGDQPRSDMDSPQGEGKSTPIVQTGDGLTVADKGGAVAELVLSLPEAEIAALGRLAAYYQEQQ